MSEVRQCVIGLPLSPLFFFPALPFSPSFLLNPLPFYFPIRLKIKCDKQIPCQSCQVCATQCPAQRTSFDTCHKSAEGVPLCARMVRPLFALRPHRVKRC
jgi:hypothetical protein